MKKIKQFIDKIVRVGNPDPLKSAEDVDNYTEAFKESMLKEIKQGNKIQL